VHPWCCLPCRGRLEHLHVPGERQEEQLDLHQLQVFDSAIQEGPCDRGPQAAGRPVLPSFVVDSSRWVQHLHVPSKWSQERSQVHADGVPDAIAA